VASSAENKPGHLRLTKQENAYYEELFSAYSEADRARKDKVTLITNTTSTFFLF
jgi:hypothetical protein